MTTQITEVLVPPSRSSTPATFSTQADTFVSQLPTWTTQANAVATEVNAKEAAAAASASAASGSATAASGSATTATTQAGLASGSATSASGFATAASGSATSASGFATAASGSASAAAASAASISGGPVTSVNTHTGVVVLAKSDIGLGSVDNTADSAKSVSSAATLTTPRTINGVSFNGSANITINAVDATARVASSLIGAASGIAPLGADSKIASTYLPSYVDDVLEVANYAALPGTGETGKIYVALDTNKTWRWSGSVYVEISASPGSSDAVTEGVTNLYYTTARAAVKQDLLVSANNIKTINSTSLLGSGNIVTSSAGAFTKTDPTTVAFAKTGAGTAQIKAGTKVDVVGTLVTFASATSITMPTLTAGTDYAVWVKDDATIQATTNFSSAPAAGNWRKIGGFHYAPGGNATARAGGDTTPAINAYSFWDITFRPACQDPRGMTLVADSFWTDIYLLGVDHLTNGTSKYNVTIADGSSPPKIPTKFGGNGSTAYGTLTWWGGAEVLQAWGKRYPTYDQFAALAFGTTEASSFGTDPGTTVLNAAYTSQWGCMQATGVMWVWGADFGGGAAAAAWVTNTDGRGDTYQLENAVLFGGNWNSAANSGSRASSWSGSPTLSYDLIGVRAVCDHLILG